MAEHTKGAQSEKDRQAELEAVIAAINKKGEILFRGSDLLDVSFQRATTGSLSLDLMLGGGWPLNCLNEVIGVESSGKTSLTLKTIAAQQARNPDYHTLWVASEDFDFEWAATLGVDVSRMTFVLSNIMEEAYEACLRVMTQRAADAVIIDSMPALVPSEENEKTMMDLTVGRQRAAHQQVHAEGAHRHRSQPDRARPFRPLPRHQPVARPHRRLR